MIIDLARILIFPALMAYAAASDLLTMTIPNRVSIALIAGFVLLAGFSGMPLATFGMHLAAGLIVLLVAFGCFAMGWVGGGDAKIAAAASIWFGFDHVLIYLIYASLLGGGLTLLLLELRQWPLPYPFSRQEWALRIHAKDSGIPYGIALGLAGLIVYPDTTWIRAADISKLF